MELLISCEEKVAGSSGLLKMEISERICIWKKRKNDAGKKVEGQEKEKLYISVLQTYI